MASLVRKTSLTHSGAGSPGRSRKQAKQDRSGLKGNRGNTKKGGGGSKYTWGKPGDELNAAKTSRDDPNYDSQEEDGIMFVSSQAQHERAAIRTGICTTVGPLSSPPRHNYSPLQQRPAPQLSLAEFKAKVIAMLTEFFIGEDLEELAFGVEELRCPHFHYELVKRAITMAMERKSRAREIVSVMLNKLRCVDLLSIEQVGKGFERLFEVVEDIELDTPGAKKLIAQFLARAVVDEVLPPSFLQDPLVEGMGGEMVEQAKVLLSIKHGVVRLENVWGPGDGSSVAELKKEILMQVFLNVYMLLREYASTLDADEAVRCVKRLNVPHFHHEVIKRAVVLAMDARRDENKARAMMSSLIFELYSREVTTRQQIQLGFQRLYDAIPDLELDTPGAASILDVFAAQAERDGILDVARIAR